MEKIKRHYNIGFTLIEILISFAIFAVLMGIVLTGFMDTRKLERLKQSAGELVSTLQKAQNYALTGYASSGFVPSGGYGVHLSLSALDYFIFADTASVTVSSGCDPTQGNQRYDPAYDPPCNEQKVGSDYSLQSGVIIYRIKIAGLAVNDADISFKSPLRMPYVGTGGDVSTRYPGVASSKSVDIYLKWKDKNVCRKVSVKANAGQISEQAVAWTECNN